MLSKEINLLFSRYIYSGEKNEIHLVFFDILHRILPTSKFQVSCLHYDFFDLHDCHDFLVVFCASLLLVHLQMLVLGWLGDRFLVWIWRF